MTIHLTRTGVPSAADVGDLADQFNRQQCARLPRLLDAELMRMIGSRLETAQWKARNDGNIARELILDDAGVVDALHLVTNGRWFLNLIEQITQCGAVTRFEGRVYRMAPGGDHFDSWHTDAATGVRLVGMSVNLSPREYSGGVFQLRRHDAEELLAELPNVGPGDAILFRISPTLMHRVTPVHGTEPKTAFAGWFTISETDWFSFLHQRAPSAS